MDPGSCSYYRHLSDILCGMDIKSIDSSPRINPGDFFLGS